MDDSYLFYFEKDKYLIERKEGKILCQGYDVESERVALILSGGFGEGIRVVLVALEELGMKDVPLKDIMVPFIDDLSAMGGNKYFFQDPTSALGLNYISYNESDNKRLRAIKGKLPGSAWKRLLYDRYVTIVTMALSRASGPKEELRKFLHHHDPNMRRFLALNPHLSFASMAILAKDEDEDVRRALMERPGKLPLAIRKLVEAKGEEIRSLHHLDDSKQAAGRAKHLLWEVEQILLERPIKEYPHEI